MAKGRTNYPTQPITPPYATNYPLPPSSPSTATTPSTVISSPTRLVCDTNVIAGLPPNPKHVPMFRVLAWEGEYVVPSWFRGDYIKPVVPDIIDDVVDGLEGEDDYVIVDFDGDDDEKEKKEYENESVYATEYNAQFDNIYGFGRVSKSILVDSVVHVHVEEDNENEDLLDVPPVPPVPPVIPPLTPISSAEVDMDTETSSSALAGTTHKPSKPTSNTKPSLKSKTATQKPKPKKTVVTMKCKVTPLQIRNLSKNEKPHALVLSSVRLVDSLLTNKNSNSKSWNDVKSVLDPKLINKLKSFNKLTLSDGLRKMSTEFVNKHKRATVLKVCKDALGVYDWVCVMNDAVVKPTTTTSTTTTATTTTKQPPVLTKRASVVAKKTPPPSEAPKVKARQHLPRPPLISNTDTTDPDTDADADTDDDEDYEIMPVLRPVGTVSASMTSLPQLPKSAPTSKPTQTPTKPTPISPIQLKKYKNNPKKMSKLPQSIIRMIVPAGIRFGASESVGSLISMN